MSERAEDRPEDRGWEVAQSFEQGESVIPEGMLVPRPDFTKMSYASAIETVRPEDRVFSDDDALPCLPTWHLIEIARDGIDSVAGDGSRERKAFDIIMQRQELERDVVRAARDYMAWEAPADLTKVRTTSPVLARKSLVEALRLLDESSEEER